uniref:Uncharacterized protein n=1 Tax=Arundo donax TaxID=35708 RepID=A0A0A9AVU4_ARUDO
MKEKKMGAYEVGVMLRWRREREASICRLLSLGGSRLSVFAWQCTRGGTSGD